ncbi:MAG: InlB B-repeat-containing protein, partial [Phocaeicola sp.]
YALEGWYDGDVKLVTGDDITVSGDTLNVKLTAATNTKTYTAKFQLATYKVTFASDDEGMGTVDPSGEQGGIAGNTISSVATANTNYVLEGWYDGDVKLVTGGDITVSGDTLNMTLTETTKDKTYTAKFQRATYKVTFASDDEGMGMVLPTGEQSGYAGDTISSVAIANTDYAFEGWYDKDGNPVAGDDITVSGNRLDVKLTTATKDNTYTAKFQRATYKVTFFSENVTMGTVDPSGDQLGDAGDIISSVAITKTNYVLEGWYEGGVKLVTGGDITVNGNRLDVKLTEATKNKTYIAKFQLATYQVTFASENSTMGTVDPSGERDGIAGSTISSVATANTDYVFEGWYEGGVKLVTGGDITVSGNRLDVKLTE